MATVWTPLGALVFDPFTTVQRDALVAQERMVIYNSDTSRFEIYISGSWRDFSEYIGTVGISEHEEIASGNLHPEYAHPQHPEGITGTWQLLSGGRITSVSGDPPKGEVIIQVKTTTGAPTHSASRGVFCLVYPDSVVYLNMVGGTTWVRLAGYSDLHAVESGESGTHTHGNLYYTEGEVDALLHAEVHDYDTHDGGVPYDELEYDDATSNPLPTHEDTPADGTEDSAARKDHVHALGGAAGGDLGGTYPNPTVDDGADSTAIHDNVAGEIVVITEKTTPVANDEVVIEDSADSNNKKSLKISNLKTPLKAVLYSVHQYVFIPDAGLGEDVETGTVQGLVHVSGPSTETVKRITVIAETAAGTAFTFTLDYDSGNDDFDAFAVDTEIDEVAVGTAKGIVVDSGFTNATIAARSLLALDVITVTGTAPKDVTIILEVWRPLQT